MTHQVLPKADLSGAEFALPGGLATTDHPVSDRASRVAAATPFRLVFDFFEQFYDDRRHQPRTLDFTFGDPHEMPSDAYVQALGDALAPRNELWFAYKRNEPEAQRAAAASLRRTIDLPFEADDIHMTTGRFAEIALALKAVADPGEEVVYSLSPWFMYEPLVLEAGLVPVKVAVDAATFDLDIEAIAAAITPRTRVVTSARRTTRRAGSTPPKRCASLPRRSTRHRPATGVGSM